MFHFAGTDTPDFPAGQDLAGLCRGQFGSSARRGDAEIKRELGVLAGERDPLGHHITDARSGRTGDLLCFRQFSCGDERGGVTQVIFEIDGLQRLVYTLNQAETQRVGVRLAGGGL